MLASSAALAADSEKDPAPAKNRRFLVTLTLRDDTSVHGELVGFAGGYFLLETRRGRLTIPGDRVAKLTPIAALPPAPKPWRPRPLSEEERKQIELMVKDRGRQFVKAIQRPELPARHNWAFRMIAGIAIASVQLQNVKLPFEIIEEARQAQIAKTGERRCVLIACEAVVYGILGQKDKAKETLTQLPNHGVGARVQRQLNAFVYALEAMKDWRRRP